MQKVLFSHLIVSLSEKKQGYSTWIFLAVFPFYIILCINSNSAYNSVYSWDHEINDPMKFHFQFLHIESLISWLILAVFNNLKCAIGFK